MKIIDLLNKIAEGKELPKKFMWKEHLYYRQKTKGVYYRCDELNEIFEERLMLENLNDTIEIIEEPKKIEKIPLPSIDEFKKMSAEERYVITAKEYDLLNELIDEINNLKEK